VEGESWQSVTIGPDRDMEHFITSCSQTWRRRAVASSASKANETRCMRASWLLRCVLATKTREIDPPCDYLILSEPWVWGSSSDDRPASFRGQGDSVEAATGADRTTATESARSSSNMARNTVVSPVDYGLKVTQFGDSVSDGHSWTSPPDNDMLANLSVETTSELLGRVVACTRNS
jgi:hypothetical protein